VKIFILRGSKNRFLKPNPAGFSCILFGLGFIGFFVFFYFKVVLFCQVVEQGKTCFKVMMV